MPDLPFELIFKIVEDVRRPDLKSTSLVCTSLQEVSQRRLFEIIHLSGDEEWTRKRSRLASSPRLISYVRDLSLSLSNVRRGKAQGWVCKDNAYITDILEKISIDQIVRFDMHDEGTLFCDDDSIYPTGARLRLAILSILKSSSLVKLELTNAPYTLLHDCLGTSLKVVKIDKCYEFSDSNVLERPPIREVPLSLDALYIDLWLFIGLPHYLFHPNSLIDLANLRHLTFVFTARDKTSELLLRLQKLLDACCFSLENLVLQGSITSENSEVPRVDLGRMAKLRQLRFAMRVDSPLSELCPPDRVLTRTVPPALQMLILQPLYYGLSEYSYASHTQWINNWKDWIKAVRESPSAPTTETGMLSKFTAVEVIDWGTPRSREPVERVIKETKTKIEPLQDLSIVIRVEEGFQQVGNV